MADLLFPLQFRRQFDGPLDLDGVFDTVVNLNAYLTNARRYAGQIVACDETPGVAYVLNAARDAWLPVASLALAQTFTAGQRGQVVTLVDAATVAVDLNDGNNFDLTITDDRAIDEPTNIVAGQGGTIAVRQDATGGWTLTWDPVWVFPAGAPVIDPTPNALTTIAYQVMSATEIVATVVGAGGGSPFDPATETGQILRYDLVLDDYVWARQLVDESGVVVLGWNLGALDLIQGFITSSSGVIQSDTTLEVIGNVYFNASNTGVDPGFLRYRFDDSGVTAGFWFDATPGEEAVCLQVNAVEWGKVPGTDWPNIWTKGQIGRPVALTDAANIVADLALANNFTLTLDGSRTLDDPTNAVAGQSGIIVVTQGVGGSHLLAYGSAWYMPGGVAPVLSTAVGAIDVLSYYVITNAKIVLTVAALDVKEP
jgi:hypothetical protein